MRTSTVGSRLNKESGYSYIMLLIVMASLGLLAAAMGAAVYDRQNRVEKEMELLFRGMAYKEAIRSYYDASQGLRKYPSSLEELLSDSRFPEKRHIRRLYNDPVTRGEWVLIMENNGTISGVRSSSRRKPMKQEGFPEGMQSFEKAEHYSDWIFDAKK